MNVALGSTAPGTSSEMSCNWKALQKSLLEESAQKALPPTEDGFTVVKRKRKRRHNKLHAAETCESKKVRIEEAQTDVFNGSLENQPSKGEASADDAITQTLALDCEYVGAGPNGEKDVLARVSIVNADGNCVYDKYVKPSAFITDHRTAVSGIRPGNLINGESFEKVRHEVLKLISGRIIVGHGLENDFKVLNLSHPRQMTRDTARYAGLRQEANKWKTPSLKLLARTYLGIDIQLGEHSSITDARVAMQIYNQQKKKWELFLKRYRKK